MLWVTSIDRMVTNTSRPMTTGPAGVDERLVADEREVADGERRPRIAPRRRRRRATSRPKYPFSPMKARRHCTSSRGPKLVSAPTANTSSQWTSRRRRSRRRPRARSAVRSTIVRSPSRTPSPIDAPCTAVRVAALVGRERPEGLRVRAQRLEKAVVELPVGLRQLEHGGETHALERDAREELRRCRHAACAATSRSTSSAVMKPSFSIDARSMPCSSASSTARRVAFAGPAGSAAPPSRASLSAAASSASLSATSAMRPPSSTSSPCGVEVPEDPVAGRLELEQRLRRLDLADGLALRHALAVGDEPFDEESPLACSRPRG